MNRQLSNTFVVLGLLISLFASAQAPSNRISREDYINKYKDLAIKEMKRTGIPASITMAQGILESDNGNSNLARKSNNHFGIKCHSDWNGKRVYHHDDRRNECFRKYKTVYESYLDHSAFLVDKKRYASLFELKTTDYKGWAKGLKKAGYATDPHYAKRLIQIIEENKLYQLDTKSKKRSSKNEAIKTTPSKSSKKSVDNFTINPFNSHEVGYNNGVKYIKTTKGDTFEGISEEFGMQPWEIYKYNDLPNTANIDKYRHLYIQTKRGKAHKKHEYHMVKKGETLHYISQKYGIKLKKLKRFNNIKGDNNPKAGTRLNLRRRAK
ncbi:LysM peptidoglycan-binding domain-containing protein [Marinilabiliaceae bacterium JC017]|nr:LysM peptidoglycan-binding domain-containing protein [Marinilabiliaceae bacterium JC017]